MAKTFYSFKVPPVLFNTADEFWTDEDRQEGLTLKFSELTLEQEQNALLRVSPLIENPRIALVSLQEHKTLEALVSCNGRVIEPQHKQSFWSALGSNGRTIVVQMYALAKESHASEKERIEAVEAMKRSITVGVA